MFLMCLAAISHLSTRMEARYPGYGPHYLLIISLAGAGGKLTTDFILL